MRNKYAEIIKGLPGGPNENLSFPSGWGYSSLGYKRNSPDINNPFNIIPSGRITMKDVDFPITGIDDLGNEKLMFPGNEYEFPGSEVFELPHKEHRSLEWEGRPLISNDGFEGFEGGFHSKYLDMHATYRKPLQMIGDGHLSLTGHLSTGPNEFSFTPSVHIGGHGPEFGINIGFKHSFQPGGETGGMGDPDMLDFYYDYMNSDKYKERLKSSGYANPQEIAGKRQGSHFNTKIHYKDEVPGNWNAFMDILQGRPTNASGSSYIPGDKMGGITTGDIVVYDGQADLEDTTSGDIERHERAHAMVQDAELNDYDQRQFSERETESSRNKGYRHGKKIPIGNQQLEESYADMTGLRYTIFDELGIDATKDITDEDMSKIQNLIKDSKYKSAKRLFDAYSPEDIKWMLNNIASNQSASSDQMQMAQDGDEINFYSPEPIDNTYVDQSILNNQLTPFRSFAHLTYEEQMALIKNQKIEAAMRLLRRSSTDNNNDDIMYDFNSQNVPIIFQDGDEVTGVNPGSGYDTDHKIQYVDTDKEFNTGFETQDRMLKEAMATYKQSMLSQSGATAHAPEEPGIPSGGIGDNDGGGPPEFTKWEEKHGDWDGHTWVPDERFKGIKGAIDNIGTRRQARKDFRSAHPKTEQRRFDKWNRAGNIFRKRDDKIRNKPEAFREYHPRVGTDQEGNNLRHWSNMWMGVRDKSQFDDFNFFKNNKPFKQDGGENEQYANAYLNDLYISSDDLTYLNHEDALDLNLLPKEKWNDIVDGREEESGEWKKMTYKEIADYYDGTIPWDMLNTSDKHYSNQYYCDPSKGCLASSFDAYDQTVGQKYPSTDFLSEAKLKNEMNLQSLQGYSVEERSDGTKIIIDPNGNQVSDRTKQWIDSIPYFQYGDGNSRNYDFAKSYNKVAAADSWDIHGVVVDRGGKNIFTGGKDYSYDTDEYQNQDDLADFSTLSDSEKQAIYAQMTPGTIVGFGKYTVGENQKYGLTGSTHSTQVVGFAEDGVPIIYDYGKYVRLDDPNLYGTDNISNITIPKQQLGKNLEWAKSKGYYKNEGPSDLNFDISPLYEEGDEDELKPFYDALSKKKRRLMNDLNIKPEDYDMMAKTLIGITMAETTGGAGVQHNIEGIIPGTPFQETAGLTQLTWTNIENDPKLKKVAARYGITEISDLKDPGKSAIASMIYGHRNMQAAKKNWEEGKGHEGTRTYYPADSWKQETKQLFGKSSTYDGYKFKTDEGPKVDFFTGNKYIGLGWDKSIEDIQAQFDEIAPGKYTVREEDGDYVVDKVTKGNSELSPEEMFIYNWNSPNILKSGDAQGGSAYVRGILEEMDKFQIGGEVVPEDVQAMKDSLEQELQNLKGFKMNPAQQLKLSQQLHDTYNENVPRRFKIGGPKLSKELQLYKDYIIGSDDSEKARKNYDKLNRVYYREAKVKNMKPANYIMTTMIS